MNETTGAPIDADYAATRSRWEPVYEATQIKGDSEAHPLLSPNDEFADFGTWDKGDIGGRNVITEDMLPHQYVRSALRLGLQQEDRLGVNPFKFGLIGSTDAHTALATSREDNYFGKNPPGEPASDRWEHVFMEGQEEGTTYYNWETLASGLAESGHARIPAKRSGTPSNAKRSMRPRAPGSLCESSADGTSPPMRSNGGISPIAATPAVCRWAAISRLLPRGKRQGS